MHAWSMEDTKGEGHKRKDQIMTGVNTIFGIVAQTWSSCVTLRRDELRYCYRGWQCHPQKLVRIILPASPISFRTGVAEVQHPLS